MSAARMLEITSVQQRTWLEPLQKTLWLNLLVSIVSICCSSVCQIDLLLYLFAGVLFVKETYCWESHCRFLLFILSLKYMSQLLKKINFDLFYVYVSIFM